MLGVPARRRGWVCECGEILPKELHCAKCGRKYMQGENGLQEVE
jgi:UDP-2-acetamido-3-amino-2,3-dideoxy-glucuronate N-acetyltransferase